METDMAEDCSDDSVRMSVDSNTNSITDVAITSETTCGENSGSTNNNDSGIGKAFIEYLRICGSDHRTSILAVLNKDRDGYNKQMKDLQSQMNGVEKEIQDAESEMEEKNNRLKDILLEVEQLQTRIFNLAKQTMCQKQTLKTLEKSTSSVNVKLQSCEKAILDMS
ncbi:uncharacterized protein LOC117335584 [Pecten maximus]|uniref:uncharacterized protein LOC117335584 n=1 Tax=Pecten maximus TaxID=6579 RepID=UPI0014582700|nr:uncharacterized protein LOC117335584 [Pecten maximus]